MSYASSISNNRPKRHVISLARRSRRGHSFFVYFQYNCAVYKTHDALMNSVRLFRSGLVSSLAVRMCSTKSSYEVRVLTVHFLVLLYSALTA